MLHLTVDEIIEFVSVEKLNDETMRIIANVNSHISKCDECREKVKAFQTIYDEFVSLLGSGNVKNMLYHMSENNVSLDDPKSMDRYLEQNR